jgi:hypothetical protein
MRVVLLVIGALAAALVLAAVAGAWRWRAATTQWAERLDQRPAAGVVSFAGFDTLPAPVARYLRAVLVEGQPHHRFAELRQEGQFLVKPPEGWRPFTATHRPTTEPPAFLWDAAISMGPGLAMRVRDRFLDGQGAMHGALLGLVTVVRVEGTPDIAAGALHRWLAEAPWCPTALLPRPRLAWTALDDATARATVTAGRTTVSADFHFGTGGLVERVYVADRMRDVKGTGVPTPWEGRFHGYTDFDGMKIPAGGDVGWVLDGTWQPYFRGTITEARYQ